MEDFCRKSMKADPEPKLAGRQHLSEEKDVGIGNQIDPENRVGNTPSTEFSWV